MSEICLTNTIKLWLNVYDKAWGVDQLLSNQTETNFLTIFQLQKTGYTKITGYKTFSHFVEWEILLWFGSVRFGSFESIPVLEKILLTHDTWTKVMTIMSIGYSIVSLTHLTLHCHANKMHTPSRPLEFQFHYILFALSSMVFMSLHFADYVNTKCVLKAFIITKLTTTVLIWNKTFFRKWFKQNALSKRNLFQFDFIDFLSEDRNQ